MLFEFQSHVYVYQHQSLRRIRLWITRGPFQIRKFFPFLLVQMIPTDVLRLRIETKLSATEVMMTAAASSCEILKARVAALPIDKKRVHDRPDVVKQLEEEKIELVELYKSLQSLENNFSEMVANLQSNLAEVEKLQTSVDNSLLNAVGEGYGEVVDSVLERGARIDARHNGMTPLRYAAWFGHGDVLDKLLVHGAEIDAMGDNGCTPLRIACMRSNPGVVKKLLRAGADTLAKRDNDLSLEDLLNGVGGEGERIRTLLSRHERRRSWECIDMYRRRWGEEIAGGEHPLKRRRSNRLNARVKGAVNFLVKWSGDDVFHTVMSFL